MKTITLSDSSFEALKALLTEMNTQESDCQAAPRFWVPRSTRETVGNDDDRAVLIIDGATGDMQSIAEDYSETWEQFCIGKSIFDHIDAYDFDEDPHDWKEYIIENIDGAHTAFVRDTLVQEMNPSFFKSDVQEFIEFNKHRLGENPHTYANSIFRMNKMAQLMNIMGEMNASMNPELQAEADSQDDDIMGMQ